MLGDDSAVLGDGERDEQGTESLDCQESGFSAVPFPLQRLTNAEYRASVTRLLGVAPPASLELEPDGKVGGFFANWVSPVGQVHLERYVAAAEQLATQALLAGPDRFRTCAPPAPPSGTNECLQLQLSLFVERAYRMPPTPEELEELLARHATWEAEWGPADADRMLIEGVLLAPQFLYHTPPEAGREPYALASRLAFFLTGHPPDDALLALAADGRLADPETRDAEVERLLSTPEAQGTLRDFFFQWLELERLEGTNKDTSVFPEWSPALRHSMLEETDRFITHVLSEGGGLTELLTSRTTFVDPLLADVYGIAETHGGAGWELVELPADSRSGLLTQASFLAGHAHQVEPSWVLRGDFVRRRLLCDELPPPPDVDLTGGNDATRLEQPACRGCHELMDPIGASFDRYDALGRYSEVNGAGREIPTEGDLREGSRSLDVAGPFSSPLELSERLSNSTTVRSCLVNNLFRFAHRRLESAGDACSLRGSLESLEESGDLRTLLGRLATAPDFFVTERQ